MRNVGSMQSAHSFITVKEYLKVYHRKLTNHEWQFGRNWKCFFHEAWCSADAETAAKEIKADF